MASTAATVLGFDYGETRLGVAVGQTVTRSASPLAIVSVRDGRPDWPAITELVEEYTPQYFVVGLPVHEDGSEHRLAPRVERFRNQLQQRYRLPVHTIDERLSSREAALRRQNGERHLDAIAAQVILETWMNENPPP